MDCKDLVFNNGSDREVVEQISDQLPHRGTAVLSLALRVEPVDLSNLSCFVVAPQESDPQRVAQLEQKEVADCFDRKRTPVHVVSEEEVVGVRDLSAHPEELYQIVELPILRL